MLHFLPMDYFQNWNAKLLLNCQWIRILLALSFGSLGTFAFSPFDFWPIAILSLAGLLLFILNSSTKQAAIIGFSWGIGLFVTGTHWIYISLSEFSGMPTVINIFLFLLLSCYLSCYPSLFSATLTNLYPKTTWYKFTMGAPVLWQISEFLRGWVLTGFPWLQFGYSQISGPLRDIAPILGVDGITFTLVAISGLFVYAYQQRRIILVIISLLLLFLPWSLSQLNGGTINWFKIKSNRAVNISMVQGNIKQSRKWDPNTLTDIRKIYLDTTLPYLDKSSIIIWPETAIPDIEINQYHFLSMINKILRTHHSSLITGMIDVRNTETGTHFFNKIIVLGDKDKYLYHTTQNYQKYHLVPFGEFVPLEGLIRPLAPFFDLPMSSFSRGNAIQPLLKVEGYNLTAAICYEIVLGQQIRKNFHPNTDFILTVSNDAWFGNSIEPWQHFQMARMRALEIGRPLLHSTNNGITAVVAANGDILVAIPPLTRQVLNVVVTPTSGITPYARFGSWPLWLISFIFMVTLIILEVSAKRK